MPNSRARTATLLLSLLLLAIILGTLTAGYATPVIGLAAKHPAAVTTTFVSVNAPTGLLIVKAQLHGPSISYLPDNDSVAIQGANISIRGPSSTSSWRSVPPTNSSGEQALLLAPANYTVRVSDSFFATSADVTIRANSTAEVDVTVQYYQYASNLSLAADQDSSGYLSPSEPTTLVVNGSIGTAVANNFTFFLEPQYDTNAGISTRTAPPPSSDVPVTVLSVSGRNASGVDTAWVRLEPKSPVSLAGLSSMSLVAYKPTTKVLTY
jgi:hypothetical protein